MLPTLVKAYFVCEGRININSFGTEKSQNSKQIFLNMSETILFFFGFPNLHDSCRCIYMKYLHDSCRKKKEGVGKFWPNPEFIKLNQVKVTSAPRSGKFWPFVTPLFWFSIDLNRFGMHSMDLFPTKSVEISSNPRIFRRHPTFFFYMTHVDLHESCRWISKPFM